MAELDLLANVPATLTDSNIYGIYETILQRVDDWARSKSTIYEQEPEPKAHGFVRLKTAPSKGANCHLCALFLSIFNEAELRELEDDELWVGSQSSLIGRLLAILVGRKSLNVEQISKYK